jgi:hypothetical protein
MIKNEDECVRFLLLYNRLLPTLWLKTSQIYDLLVFRIKVQQGSARFLA